MEYLDDLKEKTGSDYMTAKQTGLNKVSISCIRKRGQMSDETAIKIADLLGIDRTEVLIAAAIARSEGEVRKSWENISKITGVAASVVMACILTTNDAEAAGLSNAQNVDMLYIMRSICN
ncbi:MAG: hypothetical protein ACXVB0_24815 [Mucilaginibacter sp.]